jgi:hypothetical protein
MTNIQQLFENPTMRRWHVIDEIDLIPLVTRHVRTELLCRRLERCADGLPELADAAEVRELCKELEAHAVEQASREAGLEAVLGAGGEPSEATVLAHLRARQVACVVQAQDLVAVLRPDGVDRGPCAATLGYMIRCFFDSCRSLMAFEELAILALAGHRLTPAARLLLESRLQASCRA